MIYRLTHSTLGICQSYPEYHCTVHSPHCTHYSAYQQRLYIRSFLFWSITWWWSILLGRLSTWNHGQNCNHQRTRDGKPAKPAECTTRLHSTRAECVICQHSGSNYTGEPENPKQDDGNQLHDAQKLDIFGCWSIALFGDGKHANHQHRAQQERKDWCEKSNVDIWLWMGVEIDIFNNDVGNVYVLDTWPITDHSSSSSQHNNRAENLHSKDVPCHNTLYNERIIQTRRYESSSLGLETRHCVESETYLDAEKNHFNWLHGKYPTFWSLGWHIWLLWHRVREIGYAVWSGRRRLLTQNHVTSYSYEI